MVLLLHDVKFLEILETHSLVTVRPVQDQSHTHTGYVSDVIISCRNVGVIMTFLFVFLLFYPRTPVAGSFAFYICKTSRPY